MKVYLLYRRGYPENKLLSVCKNKTAVKKEMSRINKKSNIRGTSWYFTEETWLVE